MLFLFFNDNDFVCLELSRMDADRRLFDLTEFWLISAPGERTCQQTWDVMNSVTSKQANLSSNFKFHIPDLKVFLWFLIRCNHIFSEKILFTASVSLDLLYVICIICSQ